MKKIIYTLLLATLILPIFNNPVYSAQKIRYPVKELDNCRNAKECALYCRIPANTPACWSWQKFILNNNVLGEQTVNITYPIKDLDNCPNAKECYEYCQANQNKPACIAYAKKTSLINEEKNKNADVKNTKTGTQSSFSPQSTTTPKPNPDKKENKDIEEKDGTQIQEDDPKEKLTFIRANADLGCSDKTDCIAFCEKEENRQACSRFAQKFSLQVKKEPSMPSDLLAKAKSELGCQSVDSCRNFCALDENKDKCLMFSSKYALLKKTQGSNLSHENMQILLQLAKESLECDSLSSCAQTCSLAENRSKCNELKNQVLKGEYSTSKTDCADDTQCLKYCEENPNECPGYKDKKENNTDEKNTEEETQGASAKVMGFIGPAGCRTEKECKTYCQSYPDKCPGFSNAINNQNPSFGKLLR